MQSRNIKKKISRSKHVIYRDVEGVVYLLDSKKGTIHTLNETASFLWRQLSKPMDIEQLADALCNAYEVKRLDAYKDVREFVSGYIKQGFFR